MNSRDQPCGSDPDTNSHSASAVMEPVHKSRIRQIILHFDHEYFIWRVAKLVWKTGAVQKSEDSKNKALPSWGSCREVSKPNLWRFPQVR